jgi:hypothetical protein
MNYAVVILAFVMFIATAYWYIHGRTYYTGPRVTARIVDGHVVLAEERENEKLSDSEKTPAGLGAALQ